jgi:hypothetical protein
LRTCLASATCRGGYLTRLDVVILDELGHLPFAQSGGQLLFHLISRLYDSTSLRATGSQAYVVSVGCEVSRRSIKIGLSVRTVWRDHLNDVDQDAVGVCCDEVSLTEVFVAQ